MGVARPNFRRIAPGALVCVLAIMWAMTGSAAARELATTAPAAGPAPATPSDSTAPVKDAVASAVPAAEPVVHPTPPAERATPVAKPATPVADATPPPAKPTTPAADATPSSESAAPVVGSVDRVVESAPRVEPTPVADAAPPTVAAEPVVQSAERVVNESVRAVAPGVSSGGRITPPPVAGLVGQTVEPLLAPVAGQAEQLLRGAAPLVSDPATGPSAGGSAPAGPVVTPTAPTLMSNPPLASVRVAGEHAAQPSTAGAPDPVTLFAASTSAASTPSDTRSQAGRPYSPTPGSGPESLPSSGATASGGFAGFFFIPFSALLVLMALAAPGLLRRLKEASAILRPTLFVCALERPG